MKRRSRKKRIKKKINKTVKIQKIQEMEEISYFNQHIENFEKSLDEQKTKKVAEPYWLYRRDFMIGHR